MDIIHLLPDSVANQIAAGEVVQRPASVIKELMENAVDAGASTIDVLVQDAGRTSIQVIDDGKGMTETDARMAFERHATSKIAKAEDLFTLQTMGFRGEALPSIAAVSQVKLTTRTYGRAGVGRAVVPRRLPCRVAGGMLVSCRSQLRGQQSILQCAGTKEVPQVEPDGAEQHHTGLRAHCLGQSFCCLHPFEQWQSVDAVACRQQLAAHRRHLWQEAWRTAVAGSGGDIAGEDKWLCGKT